ncbi:hypothetical protein ACJRO7_013597 [Eucalyptus globulus]|uniref:TIR domain-containing protein n=1 Tax=Eucalyptus globulus TaxID=34317 RepID=A0ABD3KXA5_EUCGL
MEDGNLKRAAETSSLAVSKQQRNEELIKLSLFSFSDLPEENNVPSESGANSGPSASYGSVIGNNYYVFLSFRGSDTRNGFVDHLYHRLQDVGLSFHPNFVFKDDKDLPKGEDIDANLISAITRSKVSIPIISENYAASYWCLRELSQIVECKENRKQIVLPVLYKVKPKDVREMQGKFGDAFRCHKHKFDKEVKRKGQEALKKAVAYSVYESEKFASGHEGELVKELVKTILSKQQHDFLPSLPKDLVGIDDHVARVMNLAKKSVDTASSETQIIMIYGIGGIGKTTLATTIYKKLSNKFEYRSFLKDIRETINRKGVKYVQYLHILNLTTESGHGEHDSGIEMIRHTCKEKKVLILLDDVDCEDHLGKLIGGCTFTSGSWIIITCRDKSLLKSEYKGYELKGMNHKDSLLLFSRYALRGEQPSTKLAALSRGIVRTTGGLPLTLMIIGSLLKGKPEHIWIEMQEKLEKMPNKDVQKMLGITYDSLEYEEQQMFLDIACLFIGIHKRIAIYLWKDILWCQHSGLDRLIELSLIKFDDDDKLRMHDHLRDLGRAIARPRNKTPWDCRRQWGEEAITVQRSKVENRNIEALRLDENGSSMFMDRRRFEKMPNLKFLHLSEVDLVGNFEDSLSELRWLEWEKCPNSFKATNVHLEKLLILDLSHGDICHEWRGWSSIKMERLKVLNLSGCCKLRSNPNLSAFKSLEMLILENCQYLMNIDDSIGDVKCLIHLNLRGCHHLKELPKAMGELKELKELIIGNTSLKKIPPCIGSLKKLEMLDAYGCRLLDGLPNSISQLVNLLTLDLTYCFRSSRLPENFISSRLPKNFISLVKLPLVKLPCPPLKGVRLRNGLELASTREEDGCYHIPNSIGKLERLTKLDLSKTNIRKLPESIGDLKNLKILRIVDSLKLKTLPSTIHQLDKLEEIHASGCGKMKWEIHIDGLSSLRILRLDETLVSGFTDTIDKLSCLQELDLRHCVMLRSLPELPAYLTSLTVTCQHHTLPQLSHLIHLKKLFVSHCETLKFIPELPSGLLELDVRGCDMLEELPSLSSLEFLWRLTLVSCYKVYNIDGLEQLKSLRDLCIDIGELDGPPSNDDLVLEKLENLEGLAVRGYQSLRRLDISQSSRLKELKISNCINLVKIECLDRLKDLKTVTIEECKGLHV